MVDPLPNHDQYVKYTSMAIDVLAGNYGLDAGNPPPGTY